MFKEYTFKQKMYELKAVYDEKQRTFKFFERYPYTQKGTLSKCARWKGVKEIPAQFIIALGHQVNMETCCFPSLMPCVVKCRTGVSAENERVSARRHLDLWALGIKQHEGDTQHKCFALEEVEIEEEQDANKEGA